MILTPKADSELVMRTWGRSLGPRWVRWFPGHWKLKERKERERFQAKCVFPDNFDPLQNICRWPLFQRLCPGFQGKTSYR